jgi:hypothetical protein
MSLPEPAPTPEGGHYYIFNNAVRDFMVGAQHNADCTGKSQTVHHHPYGFDCTDYDHTLILPDPARSAAVGGTERR